MLFRSGTICHALLQFSIHRLTRASAIVFATIRHSKKEIVERRLRNEINRGVQTIQYQVVTLMTTNGQAPFITVFMYLGEARNAQEKADLAIIIEETTTRVTSENFYWANRIIAALCDGAFRSKIGRASCRERVSSPV